jgi:oligopeptidase A
VYVLQSPPNAFNPRAQVTTLFHEFGHTLQHMLTTVNEGLVSGIRGISWDAVEVASQFMENW